MGAFCKFSKERMGKYMKEVISLISEFILAHKLLSLTVALICLMNANVLLGIAIAEMKLEFNKEIMVRGILKHSAIAFAIFLIYVAGCCVPNLQVVIINENSLTLIEALDTGFLSALAIYAAKVIKNLYTIFTIDTKNTIEEMSSTTSVSILTELDADGEA